MNRNFIFRDINAALPQLMDKLLGEGHEVGSRAGRVKELTHVGITLREPHSREILLPTRKANLAAQIAETVWVLSGRNDLEFLSHYLPRAADFSDDGKTWRAGYGARLRNWAYVEGEDQIDQLADCVRTLQESALTRQAVMSIWDPAVDYVQSKDIPCNNWLSFSNRLGKMDLHVAIRSNDAMWGWSGINAFEWSALLEIVAVLCGVEVGSLHSSVTSFHLYDQHWEKAARVSVDQRRIATEPSPGFSPNVKTVEYLDTLFDAWFVVEDAIRNCAPEANDLVDNFAEPMLRSWLRVLQWWWGNSTALDRLNGTALQLAAQLAVQPVAREEKPEDNFIGYVMALHTEKDKAYGNSWRRRGEMLGIMANIARKIDRLGKNGAGDTATDTAIDLFVYLAKYMIWLTGDMAKADDVRVANAKMYEVSLHVKTGAYDTDKLEQRLTERFVDLEEAVTNAPEQREVILQQMIVDACDLASQLWHAQG